MKPITFVVAAIFAVSLVSSGNGQAPTSPAAPQSAPAPTTAPPPAATPPAPKKANWKEGDTCVQDKDKDVELKKGRHPAGAGILPASYFLPAGGPVELGLNEKFEEKIHYFAYIERVDGKASNLLGGGAVVASRLPEDHSLVKKGLAEKGDTLLTLRVPASIAGFWQTANIYVWTCEAGSPKSVSELAMPVSSPLYSSIAVWSAILILYVLAAFASQAADKEAVHWYRYLDPVYMTAGSDGKGSLSKLQILFFSMIIAGLLAYIVARTGVLSDLSQTILLLLGIAGVGSAAAKGTDTKVNRLDPDNAAWLIQKGWLEVGLASTNKASWHDIIASDGEFDVYRYQSCIFSLVVGLSLLAGGINELASFEIPTTLLGILGLSQVVYVGGKLVTPTSLSELNTAINELRALEKKYIDAALARPDPDAAAGGGAAAATMRRAGEALNKEYVEKAGRVRIQFELATGREAPVAVVQPPVLA